MKRLKTLTWMTDYVLCNFGNQGSALVSSFIKAPGISLQLVPG